MALGYGVNVNLLDPARIRFLETQQATVLQIAEALGCQDQAKAWLKQVARFDCFLSYLGLGPDSVTLYPQHQPAPSKVRATPAPCPAYGAPPAIQLRMTSISLAFGAAPACGMRFLQPTQSMPEKSPVSLRHSQLCSGEPGSTRRIPTSREG